MENILSASGGCGRFQIGHVILTQMSRLSALFGLCLMVFGAYTPSWKCERMKGNFNTSIQNMQVDYSARSNNSVAVLRDGDYYAKENSSYFSLLSGNESYEGNCEFVDFCLGIEFEKESSTIVSEFGLICEKDWVPRVMITVKMMGVLVGSFFGGQIGEAFGRKVCLYGSTAIFTLVCGIAVISVSWQMYTVLIFIIGLAIGGILSTSIVYSLEYLNSRWRGLFGSIPVSAIGMCAASFTVFVLKDWRYVHIAVAGLGFVTLFGGFWVSESVRWLAVKGKHKQVEQIVERISRINGKPLPGIEEITEYIDTVEDERNQVKKVTYLDLFRDSKMRMISIKLGVIWFILLMCYYAMGYGVSALSGDFYTNNIAASVVEIPLILTVGFLNNKFGRKKAVAFYLTVSGTFCIASAISRIFIHENSVYMLSTVLVFIAKAFSASAWCSVSVFSVEMFPTSVRNLGYGYLTMISRVGGMMAPLLIPQDNVGFIVCFATMGCSLFVVLVVICTMPETNKRALRDKIDDIADDE